MQICHTSMSLAAPAWLTTFTDWMNERILEAPIRWSGFLCCLLHVGKLDKAALFVSSGSFSYLQWKETVQFTSILSNSSVFFFFFQIIFALLVFKTILVIELGCKKKKNCPSFSCYPFFKINSIRIPQTNLFFLSLTLFLSFHLSLSLLFSLGFFLTAQYKIKETIKKRKTHVQWHTGILRQISNIFVSILRGCFPQFFCTT